MMASITMIILTMNENYNRDDNNDDDNTFDSLSIWYQLFQFSFRPNLIFHSLQIPHNIPLAISALSHSPKVKNISPQKKVTRMLLKTTHSFDEKNPEKVPADCEPGTDGCNLSKWYPRKLKRSSFDQVMADKLGHLCSVKIS